VLAIILLLKKQFNVLVAKEVASRQQPRKKE
jgi:hypothetical protein